MSKKQEERNDIEYRVDNDVATITLNRPKAGNSISPRMGAEIIHALQQVEKDPQIVGVVIRANGKVFCSGMDLRGAMTSSANPQEKGAAAVDLFATLWDFSKPLVCCLQGPVLGGGIAIFCASDVRLIDSERGWLQFPEVKRGIVPAFVSTFALPTMGPRAAQWLLTGERVPPETLEAAGIARRVKGVEGMDKAVEEVMGQFRSGGPNALKETKRLIRKVPFLSHEEAMKEAQRVFSEAVGGAEAAEGIRSFLARESPDWSLFRSKL